MATVKPVPDGYHTVTPYLYIRGASDALAFYAKAFGAKEIMRIPAPGGKIGHAEIEIGNSRLMMADEHPEMGARGPKSIGGTSFSIMLYVENADALFARAVAAGAEVKEPMQDKFYGDRSGTVMDPFGHVWHVSTHMEDVTPEELNRRMAAMGMKD